MTVQYLFYILFTLKLFAFFDAVLKESCLYVLLFLEPA